MSGVSIHQLLPALVVEVMIEDISRRTGHSGPESQDFLVFDRGVHFDRKRFGITLFFERYRSRGLQANGAVAGSEPNLAGVVFGRVDRARHKGAQQHEGQQASQGLTQRKIWHK